MTRTELKEMVTDSFYNSVRTERLYRCSALVWENANADTGEWMRVLESYNTNVGVEMLYNGNTIFYVLGSWSATTWQHVNKYIKKYNPDIVVYLTDRSDNMIEWDRLWNERIYSTKRERETAKRTDYENRIY